MLVDSEWASKCAQICIMFKFGEDYMASKVDIHKVQDLVCLIICLGVCHASWFHIYMYSILSLPHFVHHKAKYILTC